MGNKPKFVKRPPLSEIKIKGIPSWFFITDKKVWRGRLLPGLILWGVFIILITILIPCLILLSFYVHIVGPYIGLVTFIFILIIGLSYIFASIAGWFDYEYITPYPTYIEVSFIRPLVPQRLEKKILYNNITDIQIQENRKQVSLYSNRSKNDYFWMISNLLRLFDLYPLYQIKIKLKSKQNLPYIPRGMFIKRPYKLKYKLVQEFSLEGDKDSIEELLNEYDLYKRYK